MIEAEFRIRLKSGLSLFGREVLRHPSSSMSDGDNSIDSEKEDKEESRKFLVIVVHGGPGLVDHKESLPGLRLLSERRDSTPSPKTACQRFIVVATIFYDQLGCGNSDEPTPGIMNDETFSFNNYYVNELEEVVMFAASRYPRYKDNICLLGHSWGGQIVLDFLLSKQKQQQQQQQKIACAVISNTPLDERNYEQKQVEMRNALDSATRCYYEKMDQEMVADDSIGSRIFRKLIGTSDTNIIGEMKDWSVLVPSTTRNVLLLSRTIPPCLFIAGDEDTIPHQDYIELEKQLNVAGTSHHHRIEIIKGGSHSPFYGKTAETYFCLIDTFLKGL